MTRTTRSGLGRPQAGARRFPRVVPTLVAGLVLIGVAVLVYRGQSGEATPQDAGRAYADALRTGDRAAVLRLVPPSFDSAAAVDAKLSAVLAAHPAQLAISYRAHPISPNIYIADIRSPDGVFSDEVAIQRFGNRWYVTIGSEPAPADAPPTARPSG